MRSFVWSRDNLAGTVTLRSVSQIAYFTITEYQNCSTFEVVLTDGQAWEVDEETFNALAEEARAQEARGDE